MNKYPDNMQIWRHSRGIKVPKTETVKLEEISKEYPKVKYEKMFEIEIKDEKKVEGEENEKRTIKIIKQQRKKIHEPLKE